jgi:hypothetical protein
MVTNIALIFVKQCVFSNIGGLNKNNMDSLGCADRDSLRSGKSTNLIS